MSKPREHLQTHTEEFGHYGETELHVEPGQGPLEIDPLSDESLAALRRLVRYKPPPDHYPYPDGRAAVMVALFGSRTGENLNVLLNLSFVCFVLALRLLSKNSHCGHQPGQTACPGGKMDPTDFNLEATARREAFEEVGLPISESIRYLTTLPPFLARSMLLVTPVVFFVLDYSLKPELNPAEVAGIFSFPLSGFLTESVKPSFSHRVSEAVQAGEMAFHTTLDYKWFEKYPHRYHAFNSSPSPVTGLTAEILINVAKIAYGRAPEFEEKAPGQVDQGVLAEHAMKTDTWKERIAKHKTEAKL